MKKHFLYALPLVLLLACGQKQEPIVEDSIPEELKIEEVAMPDSVLRHVVLFGFKSTSSPEDVQKIVAAFKELPSKISEIKGFEWGTNNSPEGLDQGFTHCFFLTFASEADRAIYLPHPDHKAFGKVLGPYLDKVLVVDYWTQK